jgi:hypothetical protein
MRTTVAYALRLHRSLRGMGRSELNRLSFSPSNESALQAAMMRQTHVPKAQNLGPGTLEVKAIQ